MGDLHKKLDSRRTLVLFQIVFATLTSQLHALGLCQQGPVVAVGVVCGQNLLSMSMQLGGFDAVVSCVYGLSFVAYSTMTLLSSVVFIDMVRLTHKDVAYYLIAWSWVNITFFIRSISVRHYVEAVYFLLVGVGSLLDILHVCNVNVYHVNNALILLALVLPICRITYSVVHLDDESLSSAMGEECESRVDVLRQISDSTGLTLSV